MQVKKYRTIAYVYPHMSLEAEVKLADGRTVYANISVNKNGNKEEYREDCFWAYSTPMTEVLFEAVDNYYMELTDKETKEIITALLNIWNANPVFINDPNWKDA